MKRTLKAWALVGKKGKLGTDPNWGFYYAFASAHEALDSLHERDHTFKAVPCEITYKIPTKRKRRV